MFSEQVNEQVNRLKKRASDALCQKMLQMLQMGNIAQRPNSVLSNN